MNPCTMAPGGTSSRQKINSDAPRIEGQRFAFGFVIFRPKACKRLWHPDVLFALLRHLRGDTGELDPAELADEKRPVDFLTEHSSHLVQFECLHHSAFRDRNGTKFYLTTLDDLSTVVSLPEEF